MKKLFLILASIALFQAVNAQLWKPLGNGLGATFQRISIDTIANELYVWSYNVNNIGGTNLNNLKWNGTNWDTVPLIENRSVTRVINFNNSTYYISKSLFLKNGNSTTLVAKPNQNTSIEDGIVFNNNLYVYGNFDSINNVKAVSVARYDGTNWYPVCTKKLYPFPTRAAIYNNELYIAGNFQHGDSINNIAVFRNGNWQPLEMGVRGGFTSVNDIKVYKGYLYCIGYFIAADGNYADAIQRWDGARWSAVASECSLQPSSMLVYNNELYIGGTFNTINGINANGFVKFDGQKFCALGSPNAAYAPLRLLEYNHKIIAGFAYKRSYNDTLNFIAQWTDSSLTDTCSFLNGVKEIKSVANSSGIAIYPNPSSGNYTVVFNDMKEGEKMIKVYSITGQIVDEQKPKSPTNTCISFDLTQQPSGIYFVNCIVNGKSYTRKIIKQ